MCILHMGGLLLFGLRIYVLSVTVVTKETGGGGGKGKYKSKRQKRKGIAFVLFAYRGGIPRAFPRVNVAVDVRECPKGRGWRSKSPCGRKKKNQSPFLQRCIFTAYNKKFRSTPFPSP